jgi:putative Ca2+/H+ antiporter (TMEM165/GDT1 family)
MQYKLLGSTFLAIFLAEMGDKTQLAAFALSSGSSSRWSVFVGASLALIATTALAVIAGGAIGRYIPEIWIKRAAGAMFIALGIAFLLARPSPPDTPNALETPAASDAPPTGE